MSSLKRRRKRRRRERFAVSGMAEEVEGKAAALAELYRNTS